MYFFALIIAGQKTAVECTIPTPKGPAISTWDYEVVTDDGGYWLRNDLYTGIVLDVNIKNSIEKAQQIWTVYDLMDYAIRDAKANVSEYDPIECSIFDKDRKLLQLIQSE